MVEAITFTDAENTAIAENIDAALPKLKVALTPPDKMPAKIELKFRKQKLNESLSEFGLAIQNLGICAFGRDHALNNGQVMDAFCIGVRNTDLSAKLLGSQFENLADAIAFAHNKESSETIKKYVRHNRTCEIYVQDTAGDISVLQTEAENTETQKIAKVTDRNPMSPQYATQSTNPNYRESKQQNSSQAASRRYSFNQGSGRGGVNSHQDFHEIMTCQKSPISNAIYARNLGIMQIAVLVEIILSMIDWKTLVRACRFYGQII